MKTKPTTVEVSVTVKARTDKALLVDNGSIEAWVPRSMLSDWSPDTDDDLGITSIFLPEWLAIDKGLV